MNSSPDVLIIGAGPVGLALATECQRNGVSFRIVDRAPSHSTHSKALAIWSGTLECLAASGLAETFLHAGRAINGMIMKEEGKEIARISCTEGIDSLYPQPIILPQCDTEELFIEHLAKQGVRVDRNLECLEIKQDATGVDCQLKHADGTIEIVRASWVAGCDGARSVVRHSLPVEFPGVTEKMGFILADAKISGGLPTDWLVISFGKEGAVIIFPVKDDIWRFFALRPSTEDHSEPTLEEVQDHLDRTGLGDIRLSDPQWLSFFAVNERVASRNRVGRIFLLGDASHIHSPAGGQGMNTGIQDAFNLGWKLKHLTSGRGDAEAIAESYFEERHPVAEMVVKDTSKMLHFGIMNNVFTRTIKRIALPIVSHLDGFKRYLAGELSELKVGYASSPLVAGDSTSFGKKGFAPGTRVRDAVVSDAYVALTSIWRTCLASNFTLILFSGPQGNLEALEAIVKEAQEISPALQSLTVWQGASAPSSRVKLDAAGAAHERFGLERAGWYLVRPDQYVAARGTLDELDILRGYLRKVG